MYGTTCWAEDQQARQWSRQVGVERWTSLENEHVVKVLFFFCYFVFVPGIAGGESAGGARLTRVRISPEMWEVHQRRGQQHKRRAGRSTTMVARPRLFVTVFCVDRGPAVARASGPNAGDFAYWLFRLFNCAGVSSRW